MPAGVATRGTGGCAARGRLVMNAVSACAPSLCGRGRALRGAAALLCAARLALAWIHAMLGLFCAALSAAPALPVGASAVRAWAPDVWP